MDCRREDTRKKEEWSGVDKKREWVELQRTCWSDGEEE